MMLLYAHSGFRYLVILFGLATIAYALKGAITKAPFDKNMRVLGGLFAISMDVTLLSGLALLFTRPFAPYLISHIITMVFAVAVGHVVPSVMKRRPEEERSYMPYVIGTIVALGIVVAGLSSIGAPIFGSRYG